MLAHNDCLRSRAVHLGFHKDFMSLCIPESICYKNGSFLKDTKTKGNDGKIFLSRLNACAAIHFQPQILKTGVCACVCVCVGVGFPIASNKV